MKPFILKTVGAVQHFLSDRAFVQLLVASVLSTLIAVLVAWMLSKRQQRVQNDWQHEFWRRQVMHEEYKNLLSALKLAFPKIEKIPRNYAEITETGSDIIRVAAGMVASYAAINEIRFIERWRNFIAKEERRTPHEMVLWAAKDDVGDLLDDLNRIMVRDCGLATAKDHKERE